MASIPLSASKKESLTKHHRGLKNGRDRDRIKAILMLDKGYSCLEISDVLLLEEKTIRRWRDQFLARKNVMDYLRTDCRGYAGRLSDLQKKNVISYVENNLVSDSKYVRLFIKKEFNIYYTKSGCISLLRDLGFRYKQTSIMPSGMNPKHQAQFKKNYDAFASQIKEDETIVFMDGMHPLHNVETGKAWIKMGAKKEVLSNSGRARCNLNGFYNPFTQDIFAKSYATINTDATIDTYKELEAFYPNKATIYVVIDNARYYKNALVKDWLKTSRIEPIYLPPYSPNLNLIERFWKCLKTHVISNQFYPKFSDFKEALLDFCNKASPEHKALLRKSVGTQLHLLKPV